MNIQTIKEEQYTVLIIKNEHFNADLSEELKNAVTSNLENDAKNFIIEMKAITKADDNLFPALEMISNTLEKEEGFLVFVCNSEKLEKELQEKGYVTTPTFDEAVDYIFMEEIEKQLREGDEKEEEWDDLEE